MSLFKLRGTLTASQNLILGIVGAILLVLIWWAVAEAKSELKPIIEGYETHLPSTINPDSTAAVIDLDSLAKADSLAIANATEFEKIYPILPTPLNVVKSVPELINQDDLFSNVLRSIWLNLQGYLWAIFISIPVGFLLGLLPLFRGLFSKPVDALRFLPLTALTGLFIIWFGIYDEMKIAFLAFGILVYLLPVVVQRINEVKDVYLKTVFTLGATDWQTIRRVFIPSVMSKLMDDIRVLTAISWTYIIIAELLNRQGGVGSLIYLKSRYGQIEKVFAILFVIILIGFFQDRVFVYIDKRLFPHKYQNTKATGTKEIQYGIYTILGAPMLFLLLATVLPIGGMSSFLWIIVITSLILIAYGEFRLFQSKRNLATASAK